MALWKQRLKSPTAIFFSCLLAVSLLVVLLSRSYFTEPVFRINEVTYSLSGQQNNVSVYTGKHGSSVRVIVDENQRVVEMDQKPYMITRIPGVTETRYTVSYPNGRIYQVSDRSGSLLTFDEHGQFVFDAQIYVGSTRVKSEGEEEYSPASLVYAAYPEYHHPSGEPGFLFLAAGLMIYGWSSFRYERFQRLLFFLSLKWIWVNDPEPSDFYYFMTKVGGIILMAGSLFIAAQAY